MNRVLRKDGTVVTLAPSDGHYDLVIEDEGHQVVRPVSSELADDPLHTPEFESIVREAKEDLERAGQTPQDGPLH